MTELHIKVEGLDRLMAAFKKFPREVARSMSIAGHTAGDEILKTQGLRNYPPITTQRRPPQYPWYKRGSGSISKSGSSDGSSENLGRKWYIRRTAAQVEIGNVASYAKWVHGDEDQAGRMRGFGWKKLGEVAQQKLGRIKEIYQDEISRVLARLGF